MRYLFNEGVKQLEPYIMFTLKERTAELLPELKAKGRAPISLAMGAPTAKPPQFAIDRLKEILDEEDVHTYSTPRGELSFRQAVCERMKNRFNVDMKPSEVFSLIGSKEGIANLIRFLVDPAKEKFEKDIVMIPDPGYASYREILKASCGQAYPIPLTKENDYQPDMEEVFAQLQKDGFNPKKVKALIINYPNNPLGATTTKEYVKTVVEFCKKHEILLISDSAYCDLSFDKNDKPFSVFEIEGAKEVAVEFYSFSKPYALTGWRIGWVCGNQEIVEEFGKGKSTIDNGIFKAIQKVCAEVLTSKECDEYIERENAGYKSKQEIMVKGFKELGWPIDEATVPHATFYLWLPIPPRYNSAFKFCDELLEKSGIVVVPGEAFGDYGEGFFRVSYVCSESQLHEVIDRLKADGFQY